MQCSSCASFAASTAHHPPGISFSLPFSNKPEMQSDVVFLCYLCQEYTDHSTFSCPNAVCKSCKIKGHVSKICPQNIEVLPSVKTEEKSDHFCHHEDFENPCESCFQYQFHSTEKLVVMNNVGEIITLFVYMDICTEEYNYLKQNQPHIRLFQAKYHPCLTLESKSVPFDNAFFVDFRVMETSKYLR